MQRLKDSAKIMGFEVPYSVDELVKAAVEVVQAAGGGDLYLRPIAYVTSNAKEAKPVSIQIKVDIYAFDLGVLHKKENIKVGISSFVRGYPQFQMQAKTPSNYHFLTSVKEEMLSRGLDDMLLTDNGGHITEATVANIWIFKRNYALTPPNDGSILPGITRATVHQLLSNQAQLVKKGLSPVVVAEKKLTRADVYTADCVILCGTYAEIVKVGKVDGRDVDINDQYFRYLQVEFENLVRGK